MKGRSKKKSVGTGVRWFYLALLSVTVALLIVKPLTWRTKFTSHPAVYTLEKKTPMEFYFAADKGVDTVYTMLAAGTELRVLGYRNASYYHTHKLLAETADGQRGYVRVVDLDVPFVVDKTGDTVEDVRVEIGKGAQLDRYSVRVDKKNRESHSFKKLRPVLPDSLKRNLLADNSGEYYMSKKKFERLYLNRSFGAADSLYRQATMVYRDKDGLRVNFKGLCVFDQRRGHCYAPTVNYDAEGRPTGYCLGYSQGNSAWWLKILPLAGPIIDMDFFAFFNQGPVYANVFTDMGNVYHEGPARWYDYVLFALLVLLQAVALFLPPALLVLLMGFLMYYPAVFYRLSDSVLKGLIAAAAVVLAYPWMVVAGTWGMMFFIELFGLGLLWLIYKMVTRPLCRVPHERCLGCREFCTNVYDREEITNEYDRTDHRSKLVRETGRDYDTVNTVETTTWSDGSKTERVVNSRQVLRAVHGVYDSFTVQVHVTEYNEVYVCSKCGHVERVRRQREHDVSSRYEGRYST